MRAYRIAYDGSGYRGFQRQPHGNTVENVLFDALAALGITDGGKPNGYTAAGRTDAGVSAIEQTVAFEAPNWLSPRVFCGELPTDVRAWASADAPKDFHATRDATKRVYEYHLYAPDESDTGASYKPYSIAIDDDRARTVLDRLSGTHDVHNLTSDHAGTERTLDATCVRDGSYLVCEFVSSGFPREFVRRAVGLLAAVATGTRDLSFVDRVLSNERLDGPDGTAPAAPEPLLLRKVIYGLSFAVDDEAATSTQTAFEEIHVQRKTGMRVARRLRDGLSEGV